MRGDRRTRLWRDWQRDLAVMEKRGEGLTDAAKQGAEAFYVWLHDEADDLLEWRWLSSTRDLQTRTYGYDFDALAADPKALAGYLTWNAMAAFVEVAEATIEWSWKPWAIDEPFVNRERVLGEVIDVLHFLGNMLVALDVTDQELIETYREKQAVNRRRQTSGTYSARKGSLGEGSEVGEEEEL